MDENCVIITTVFKKMTKGFGKDRSLPFFRRRLFLLYQNDLKFLLDVFEKRGIAVNIAAADTPLAKLLNYGSEQLFSIVESNDKRLFEYVEELEENTLYKVKGKFGVEYMYLCLPGMQDKILMIGPYTKKQHSYQTALELAEKYRIEPRYQKLFQDYLISLPVLDERGGLHLVLETFCDHVFGVGNYRVSDIDRSYDDPLSFINSSTDENDGKSKLAGMKLMEKRYSFENDLMRYVSEGQTAKVEMLFAGFSPEYFEKRIADSLRNFKNYCIITNTLLRKAAENGGVHPVNIDKTSTAFAIKIEQCSGMTECASLMKEMFTSYCKLVNKFSTRELSPIVQKAVLLIDSDLSADLTLAGLAAATNVSAGYLSTIFRRETGKTVTDYIIEKRIKHAAYLLETTHLQIQTVALNCGIIDVQYFSKIFKRKMGKTPREYRALAKK